VLSVSDRQEADMRDEMNIWNIKKANDIKTMLIALTSEFESDQYIIDLSDNSDSTGVYIKNKDEPELRAYIYTTGQSQDCFGVDLEYPIKNNPVSLVESYENIGYSLLKNVLCTHLNIT